MAKFGQEVTQSEINKEKFKNKYKSMIKQGKKNARLVIISRFHRDHQLNMYDGTKDDIPDMWTAEGNRVSAYSVIKTFKQEIINALHEIETQVYNATTLDELNNIDNSPQAIIDKAYEQTGKEIFNIDWEKVKENII